MLIFANTSTKPVSSCYVFSQSENIWCMQSFFEMLQALKDLLVFQTNKYPDMDIGVIRFLKTVLNRNRQYTFR